MINTCFINLLSNAVKFTPIDGTIQVDSEICCEKVNVYISDSGVGISSENLQKLFRPDIKSGTLGTENEKGTGLGLILVKEFIEKNKGMISVTSAVGEGSMFTLTLPLISSLAS